MNKNIMNFVSKGDIISFVGGGGKTTIMFKIAHEAAKLGLKVLVTTTTKIFVPDEYDYDKIVLRETILDSERTLATNISVFGDYISRGKIIGSSEIDLKKYIDHEDFDLILVEADGSRRKSLKAYKANEPIVPRYSKKVIGVISLDSIGLSIDERNVYNSTRLLSILLKERYSEVTKEDIVKIVNSKSGIFENLDSKKKCLVLTKCINKERREDFKFIRGELESSRLEIEVYSNY